MVAIGTLAWVSFAESSKSYHYVAKPNIVQTTAPTSQPVKTKYTPAELKGVLSDLVVKYGGNYSLLYACITNESGFRQEPLPAGDGGLAIGPAQIHQDYWTDYCKGEGDIHNPIDNLTCFVKNNAKKKDWNWSCWDKIIGT